MPPAPAAAFTVMCEVTFHLHLRPGRAAQPLVDADIDARRHVLAAAHRGARGDAAAALLRGGRVLADRQPVEAGEIAQPVEHAGTAAGEAGRGLGELQPLGRGELAHAGAEHHPRQDLVCGKDGVELKVKVGFSGVPWTETVAVTSEVCAWAWMSKLGSVEPVK